jgi:hypothetical protein
LGIRGVDGLNALGTLLDLQKVLDMLWLCFLLVNQRDKSLEKK